MVLPLAVVIRTVNLWPAPVAGMTGVKDSPTKHDTGVTDPIGARVIIRRASSLMLSGVRSKEIDAMIVEGFTSSNPCEVVLFVPKSLCSDYLIAFLQLS